MKIMAAQTTEISSKTTRAAIDSNSLKPQKLSRQFFSRSPKEVAKDLLGKLIIRKEGKRIWGGKIVETEVYLGAKDRACHAFSYKKTPRNQALYLSGGFVYIYLVYGIHWQLNLTAGRQGEPECVLIRSLEPLPARRSPKQSRSGEVRSTVNRELSTIKIARGPGKVCSYLKLDKSFYGIDITKSQKFWVEDRSEAIRKSNIASRPRVGIDYAQEWASKPLRFYIKDNPSVSRK